MSNLQKVSRLTFIKKISYDRGLFLCSCGKYTETRISSFKNFHTRSCGCLNLERVSKMSTKHGLSYHPLRQIRDGIKRRCLNPNTKYYKDYGGRGITICDEWKNSYPAFINWAEANGYEKGLSIDRIDNNGNYEPGNCRFVTRDIQANNTRRNIFITVNGETKTLKQWCRILNLNYGAIQSRITNLKWDHLRALNLQT